QTVNCDQGEWGFYIVQIDGATDLVAGQTGSYTAFSAETLACEPLYQFHVGGQWLTASENPNIDIHFPNPGTFVVGVSAQCQCLNKSDCALPGCNDDTWDWPISAPIKDELSASSFNSALPGTSVPIRWRYAF
ncbi:MAG: hypothetical protein MJK04_30230, partial [Psychrosphaera sp.]|nr:hypothetical protein [Psychrosphaera sp.]